MKMVQKNMTLAFIKQSKSNGGVTAPLHKATLKGVFQMSKTEEIIKSLSKEEKFELYTKYTQHQLPSSVFKDRATTTAYTFAGWYQLPQNIEELDAKVRGKYLYIEGKDGETKRYTIG